MLGDADRAREWIDRALLIDPENMTMRYNLACSLTTYLGDPDGELDLLEPYFQRVGIQDISHAKVDPDMDKLRDHPRFREMLVQAETRVQSA